MLESLYLQGAPAFDRNTGVTIGPLEEVTFFFGPNGSGKTTISRAFADPHRFPGTSLKWAETTGAHGIRVYNRDYVDETLKQAASLPGVFLLGKTSAAIQSEIDELTGSKGSIAFTKGQLETLGISLASKQAEIATARNELKEAAWAKRLSVPPELHEMFIGFNNSKEKFRERLLQAAEAQKTATEDFDALSTEATAVLDDDAVPLVEYPFGEHARLEDGMGFGLLAVPVVGSGDVLLAPLIQQLENADWVQHGRHYLDQTEHVCPFCQQRTPAGLVEQLDAYFDTRYTQQVEQLKALQEHVRTWADDWRAYFNGISNRTKSTEHLDLERFHAAWLQLELAIDHLTASIASKVSSPSAMVTVASPLVEVDSINAIVANANASIAAFNLRLRNRSSVKKALLDRCWVVFARGTLATEVGRFEGLVPSLIKAEVGLSVKIDSYKTELRMRESRLRELQAQITSSKPIIDTINRLLDSVGFHSFRLQESTAIRDGYSLVREGGEIAAGTLSEGERTFITFLYFTQSLQGTPQNDSDPNDLVAVIDDPISSLDSDVLYSVSTIVRRLIADIAAGTGRVRQLVLLTHNAHFHKEVTYKAQGEKDGGWQFGTVRKRVGQPSEVTFAKINPVQTAYSALWNEVKRASQDPSASTGSLQNILRRILETYFKVLGGVDNPAIIRKFTGEDQLICRALFSWVNAGSHSIFDDLDYSPTPATAETYLRVFRRIFEEQNQGGHYLMMMGELRNNAFSTGAKTADIPESD